MDGQEASSQRLLIRVRDIGTKRVPETGTESLVFAKRRMRARRVEAVQALISLVVVHKAEFERVVSGRGVQRLDHGDSSCTANDWRSSDLLTDLSVGLADVHDEQRQCCNGTTQGVTSVKASLFSGEQPARSRQGGWLVPDRRSLMLVSGRAEEGPANISV